MSKPTIHENPLTEDQLRWVWRRYQACGFPYASFPKRFARNDFEQLQKPKGHNMAISLCYQYRRQIIRARKKTTAALSFEAFCNVVRRLYLRDVQAGDWRPPKPEAPAYLPDVAQVSPDGQLEIPLT
jgi:hypothetical protein